MFSRSHLLREVGEYCFEMDLLISVSSLEAYTDFVLSEGTSVPVPVACQGWII